MGPDRSVVLSRRALMCGGALGLVAGLSASGQQRLGGASDNADDPGAWLLKPEDF